MKKGKIILVLVIIIAVISAFIIIKEVGGFGTKGEHKDAKTKTEETAKPNEEGKAHITVGIKGSEHTLVKEGEEYVESGAFAIDDRKGPLKDYKTEGKVDTAKPGDYKVTYVFENEGARNVAERTVTVVEKDKFKADTDGVPVLMYHYVYNESQPPEKLTGNYIKDTDLEEQLKYFKEHDYYYPSYAELRAYIDKKLTLPENSVILTFDDGQYGFLENGIKVINKYKIPVTSFVIGSKEGESKVKSYRSPYVCYESHSYDMHKAGGNIGHGGVISAMTTEEITQDLKKAAELVGNNDAFAYPYGDVTDDGRQAVRDAGILCAFTTVYGKVNPGDDFTQLPRVRVQGQNSLDSFVAGL